MSGTRSASRSRARAGRQRHPAEGTRSRPGEARAARGSPPSGQHPPRRRRWRTSSGWRAGDGGGRSLVEVERLLRDQDRVRPARHAGVDGDPAGVPTHHLDEHHPVVALRGRMQAVDRIRRHLHGGVEAHRHVGTAQVVVDRLRDTDDLQPFLRQARRRAERALAADRDEPVQAVPFERRDDLLGPVLEPVGVRTGRTEDRAAARQDAGRLGDAERLRRVVEESAPPVLDADELHPVGADASADDRADHRVQSGAVSAAGQDAETHDATLPNGRRAPAR